MHKHFTIHRYFIEKLYKYQNSEGYIARTGLRKIKYEILDKHLRSVDYFLTFQKNMEVLLGRQQLIDRAMQLCAFKEEENSSEIQIHQKIKTIYYISNKIMKVLRDVNLDIIDYISLSLIHRNIALLKSLSCDYSKKSYSYNQTKILSMYIDTDKITKLHVQDIRDFVVAGCNYYDLHIKDETVKISDSHIESYILLPSDQLTLSTAIKYTLSTKHYLKDSRQNLLLYLDKIIEVVTKINDNLKPFHTKESCPITNGEQYTTYLQPFDSYPTLRNRHKDPSKEEPLSHYL